MSGTAARVRVSIEFVDTSPPLPRAWLDGALLHRNALQYTDGDTVDITVYHPNSVCSFAISHPGHTHIYYANGAINEYSTSQEAGNFAARRTRGLTGQSVAGVLRTALARADIIETYTRATGVTPVWAVVLTQQ